MDTQETKSLEFLMKKLKDDNSESDKLNTIRSLGEITSIEAVDSLIIALKESNNWVIKQEVAKSLINIGELAKEPLLRALENADKIDEAWILKALYALGYVRPEATLRIIEKTQVTPINVETENLQIAPRLYFLMKSQYSGGILPYHAKLEIKQVGDYLSKNGGIDRMNVILNKIASIDSESDDYCYYINALWEPQKTPIDVEAENLEIAQDLYLLMKEQNSRGQLPLPVAIEIKRAGYYLGINGGTDRMKLILNMVNSIDSGSGRYCAYWNQISMRWNRICGWYW